MKKKPLDSVATNSQYTQLLEKLRKKQDCKSKKKIEPFYLIEFSNFQFLFFSLQLFLLHLRVHHLILWANFFFVIFVLMFIFNNISVGGCDGWVGMEVWLRVKLSYTQFSLRMYRKFHLNDFIFNFIFFFKLCYTKSGRVYWRKLNIDGEKFDF